MDHDLQQLAAALRREEEVIQLGGGRKAIERQHEKKRLTARELHAVHAGGVDEDARDRGAAADRAPARHHRGGELSAEAEVQSQIFGPSKLAIGGPYASGAQHRLAVRQSSDGPSRNTTDVKLIGR